MYKNVNMGFCPIGKFVFSHEDALVQKENIRNRLNELGVKYTDIDSVIKDGIIRKYEHIDPVVEYMKSSKVDCLFIPHCNFGTESAAAMIAKKLEVPVLLWGPRDNAPLNDGTRLRDSLCGLFATSKVLNKLDVPFTYIENCDINDNTFKKGIDKFIRVSNIVKHLRNTKIGMLGNRIDFFWSTIMDESNLLQRFGIEILPLDLVRLVRMTKEKARELASEYKPEIEELKKKLDIKSMTSGELTNIFALRDVILEFAHENNLSAITLETFMSINEELGVCASFAQAQITDRGIPCICESDIHGAVSSIILEAAALNNSPSFFADLTIRHPENDNGILLWHDSFPLSLKHPECKGSLGSHWIIPDFKNGMCHWKLKNGEITISRFDGEKGKYKLFAESCKTIPGPFTQNTYVWVELDDWKQFERKIIYGPYIHHTACIYGNYTDVLKESCKYIDLDFDDLSYEGV